MKTSVKKTPNILLSVVIVSYNTKELLLQLLNSLTAELKNLPGKSEVIIVDNASQDDTVVEVTKKYPDIKIIVNDTNYGFSHANNIAITQSKGKYILLLNSDIRVQENSLKETLSYLEENPGMGVITSKVVLPIGSIDPACHRGFPTPWASFCYLIGLEKLFPKIKLFSGYHMWYLDINKIHEIDSPSGAFYMIKREVVKDVGKLDEDYFMYGEDLDWSYRIKKKGWKIIFFPEVSVIHYKNQSGFQAEDKNIRKKTRSAFYDAMIIFYKKHYQKKYGALLYYLIVSMITLIKGIKIHLWNYRS